MQIKRKALSSLTLLYPPSVHLLSGSLFGENNRGTLRVRELDEALLGLGGQGLIPKRIEYSERLIWFCTDDQTTASSYLRLASVVVKKVITIMWVGGPILPAWSLSPGGGQADQRARVRSDGLPEAHHRSWLGQEIRVTGDQGSIASSTSHAKERERERERSRNLRWSDCLANGCGW